MGGHQRAMAVLGHPTLERCTVALSTVRLRILAYHDVPDEGTFRWHLRHLTERYNVVGGWQVQRSYERDEPLPPRSVWLTFDDAHPAVFARAQPLLAEFGLTATVYVCPGVIDADAPYWWDIVREAAALGIGAEIDDETVEPSELEAELKRCPDRTRRRIVASLQERLAIGPTPSLVRRQATRTQLLDWLAAGHQIGNHSWDHPCLDHCDDREQERQVVAAHDWLESVTGDQVTSFAYPNGNWAAATEKTLIRLGYRTAVGFDHRIARQCDDPLRLSRLRLDADAQPARVRAVVSGAQPALMWGRDRVRTNRADDPRRLPR